MDVGMHGSETALFILTGTRSLVFRVGGIEVVTDDEDSYSIDIYNNIKHGKYKASFKRGETYRFGIVFYDKAGKKSSVIINTIHDVTIPTNSVF